MILLIAASAVTFGPCSQRPPFVSGIRTVLVFPSLLLQGHLEAMFTGPNPHTQCYPLINKQDTVFRAEIVDVLLCARPCLGVHLPLSVGHAAKGAAL